MRTNIGKLYRSSFFHHAVDLFVNDTKNPQAITRIWIKNTPCSRCCKKMVNLYSHCTTRPSIYIGHNNEEYEGMKVLMRNGFRLKAWTKVHHHDSNNLTKRHLKTLRDEVDQENTKCIIL